MGERGRMTRKMKEEDKENEYMMKIKRGIEENKSEK